MLKYHNVGDYFDWIADAVASYPEAVNNARFMAYVGRYTTDLLVLTDVCSAVIIHSRNVLTTADCVRNLEQNQRLAVSFSFGRGSQTSSQISSVTIHPTANLAIVVNFYIKKIPSFY